MGASTSFHKSRIALSVLSFEAQSFCDEVFLPHSYTTLDYLSAIADSEHDGMSCTALRFLRVVCGASFPQSSNARI
jgi:hypothetical protein